MNITKVRNSAAIVNYVKPGLEMVEMETEGSLLVGSGGEGRIGASSFGTGGNSAVKTAEGGQMTATRR
jgi:hypothetical protein